MEHSGSSSVTGMTPDRMGTFPASDGATAINTKGSALLSSLDSPCRRKRGRPRKNPYGSAENTPMYGSPMAGGSTTKESVRLGEKERISAALALVRSIPQPPPLVSLQGPEHLIASTLPSGFPPQLALRALSCYSLLRTLSVSLRLSPFPPQAFLRALILPVPNNQLLGAAHVSVLRLLFIARGIGRYDVRGDGVRHSNKREDYDGVRRLVPDHPEGFRRACDNLTYLDGWTWTLYYDDYANIMEGRKARRREKEILEGGPVMFYDMRTNVMTSGVGVVHPDELDRRKIPLPTANVTGRPGNSATPPPSFVSAAGRGGSSVLSNSRLRRGGRGCPPLVGRRSAGETGTGRHRAQPRHAFHGRPNYAGSSDDDENGECSGGGSGSATETEHSSDEDEYDAGGVEESDDDDEFTPKGMTGKKRGRPQTTSASAAVLALRLKKKGRPSFAMRTCPASTALPPPPPGLRLQHHPYPLEKGPHYPTPPYEGPVTCPGPPHPPYSEPLLHYRGHPNQLLSSPGLHHSLQPPSQLWPRLAPVQCLSAPSQVSWNEPKHWHLGDGRTLPPPPWSQFLSQWQGAERETQLRAAKMAEPTRPRPQFWSHDAVVETVVAVTPHSVVFGGGGTPCLRPPPLLSAPAYQHRSKLQCLPQAAFSQSGAEKDSLHVIPRLTSTECRPARPTLPTAPGSGPIVSQYVSRAIDSFFRGEKMPPSSPLTLANPEVARTGVVEALEWIVYTVATHGEVSEVMDDMLCAVVAQVREASDSATAANEVRKVVLKMVDTVADPAGEDLETVKLIPKRIERLSKKTLKDMVTPGDDLVRAARLDPNGEENGLQGRKIGIPHLPLSSMTAKVKRSGTRNDNSKKHSTGKAEAVSSAGKNSPPPHLRPLRHLRSGVPYYLLPPSSKLDMLEYLLDELLTLDYVISEVNRRHLVADAIGADVSYGRFPVPHELNDLCNADQCSVCGLGGDLLCCDACPGSYHRRCIDVPEHRDLGEGRWICPECAMPDPAKFGTLNGGCKSEMEWFTMHDLGFKMPSLGVSEPRQTSPPLAKEDSVGIGDDREGIRADAEPSDMCLTAAPAPTVITTEAALLSKTLARSSAVAKVPVTSSFALTLAPSIFQSRATSCTEAERKSATGTPREDQSQHAVFPNGVGLSKEPSNGLNAIASNKTMVKTTTVAKKAEDTSNAPESGAINGRFDGVELLVVHGFVFTRFRKSKEPFFPQCKMTSRTNAVDSGRASCFVDDKSLEIIYRQQREKLHRVSSLVPLNQREVYALLQFLGPEVCASWPLWQIPFDPARIWENLDLNHDAGSEEFGRGETERARTVASLVARRDSYKSYLCSPESYSPIAYINRYRQAPLPPCVPMCQVTQLMRSDHSHFEAEIMAFRVPSLPGVLTRSFAHDAAVCRALRSDRMLLDPIQPLRDYALRLEQSLHRASLLHERWGTAAGRAIQMDAWAQSVTTCRSVRCLAALLVALVDAAHSRTFDEGWSKLQGQKDWENPDDRMESVTKYIYLGKDWDPKAELRRRKLERSRGSAGMLSLTRLEPDVLHALRAHRSSFGRGLKNRKKRKQGSLSRITSSKEVIEADRYLPKIKSLLAMESNTSTLSYLAWKGREPAPVAPIKSDISNSSLNSIMLHKEVKSTKSKLSKEGHKNEVSPPKRNKSAYIHFQISMHREAKQMGKKRLKLTEFNKEVGQMWKVLCAEEKEKWKDIAKKDSQRYQVEKEAFGCRQHESVTSTEISSFDNTKNVVVADKMGSTGIASGSQESKKAKRASRRSDRVRSHHIHYDETVEPRNDSFIGGTGTSVIKVLRSEGLLDKEKDKVISELGQQLMNPNFEKTVLWPLAGRKIFDPESCLSGPVVRWLARGAGARVVPSLTYSSNFEVGRPAVCHIWKRKTLVCNSIEALAMQVRFLDSFLNKAVRTIAYFC